MDFSWRFDLWYTRLPASPREEGEVRRLVVRPAHGERLSPEWIEVSPERGIHGDRWPDDPRRAPGNQISLINVHVIESLAEGASEPTILSGDNLQVDLDLSEDNLPVGARLLVGTAILEVSPMPHRPCRHFVARFGATAAKKVARANRRGKRGRGVLCQIVQAGRIRAGDRIRVARN